MSHQLKRNAIAALLVIALAFAVQDRASALSTGPEDGRTGAPGELTCHDGCHNTFPLNSGTGSLTLTGLPGNYNLGQTYQITVNLSHPTQTRWGFELTVLDSSGNMAGTLVVTDSIHTQFSQSGGKQYVKHTFDGTFAGQFNGANWTFNWIAPTANVGLVTFYVAGNAANNNGFNTGDRIYTRSSDVPLAVELSAFTATSTIEGVLLRWRTESETANLGFDVYRVENGKAVKVNPQMIRGHGTTGEPHDYQFLDPNPPENIVLKYFIEDIDFTGKRGKSPIITVGIDKGKRLLAWGRIKAQR